METTEGDGGKTHVESVDSANGINKLESMVYDIGTMDLDLGLGTGPNNASLFGFQNLVSYQVPINPVFN